MPQETVVSFEEPAPEEPFTAPAPAPAPEPEEIPEPVNEVPDVNEAFFPEESPVYEEEATTSYTIPAITTTTTAAAAATLVPDEKAEAGSFMAKLKNFALLLKAGYFWKNALGALLFFVLCFVVLKSCLSWYTAHGSSTELPNFVDMHRSEAETLADDLGLELKFDRSIYLTILNDEAPLIQLPGLVGNYDYTQYTNRIGKTGDIRSKIRDQVYDPKQEENTILHFFYGDRKITAEDLKGGVKVPQGSELEFVVTVRQTGQVSVPSVNALAWSSSCSMALTFWWERFMAMWLTEVKPLSCVPSRPAVRWCRLALNSIFIWRSGGRMGVSSV